jgi:hypothetical protein
VLLGDATEAAGELAQHVVAGRVPEAVVDGLEVVYVDHDRRELPAVEHRLPGHVEGDLAVAHCGGRALTRQRARDRFPGRLAGRELEGVAADELVGPHARGLEPTWRGQQVLE